MFETDEAARAILDAVAVDRVPTFRAVEAFEGKAPMLEEALVRRGVAFRRTTGTHHAYPSVVAIYDPAMKQDVQTHPYDGENPAVRVDAIEGFFAADDMTGFADLVQRLKGRFPQVVALSPKP